MAAFDRVRCGIEGLDRAFDSIRLGDNVVWQLASIEEFRAFVDPFVRQALEDGRDVVYMRFTSSEPLVPELPGVTWYTLSPNLGFEPFTMEVHDIIARSGRGAFYVFDCLSELQVAWSSDLMMGNFFRLTCPYLFVLDTVAYFPILRGGHSFQAVAQIRETTQLFVDVTADGEGRLFVRPLKVWNRYSPTMFLPHRIDLATGVVEAVTDSVETGRFYNSLGIQPIGMPVQNVDSWDRFFMDVSQRLAAGKVGDQLCAKMCNMMMTRDPRMRRMVRYHLRPEDYLAVRDRMIGTGLIGGKACGMLLARRIIEERLPGAAELMEAHDSFYIGTDVFYTFIVYNDLWNLRVAQRGEEGFVTAAPALRDGIEAGAFPPGIRDALCRMLDYYGQSPIIVRSSSFLEDGFGNAFAGKYDSVFCPNSGTAEDRYEELSNAIKHVYASMMDPSALEYRRRRGLDRQEEQMALLVQRVSGSRYSDGSFLPTAAGVGYSHSAYCWMRGMDPDAGMLRLVMGLGTRAVDRTGRDYPRIVSLDRPRATTARTVAEKHRFSQRYADVIDLSRGAFVERDCDGLAPILSAKARAAVFEHDRESEAVLRERGDTRQVLFASCEGLVGNTRLMRLMRDLLGVLQDAYSYPVDIEYTINVSESGSFVVNLLQCRPLQSLSGTQRVQVPEVDGHRTVLRLRGTSMGNSRDVDVRRVVYVDPRLYHICPQAKKSLVATLVGRANGLIERARDHALLVVPGRTGTSSPELGVPVSFAEIDNFEGVVETTYGEAGFSPELSYGSHMFQDLVETDIYYAAVFEGDRTPAWHPALLEGLPDCGDAAEVVASDDPDLRGIVRVLDTSSRGLHLWYDMLSDEALLGME